MLHPLTYTIKMRRLSLFLLFIAVFTLNAAAEAYRYVKYDVQMRVHANGTYSIVEDMQVTFTEPRHGIVREWPTSVSVKRLLPDCKGGAVAKVMTYDVHFDNVSVSEEFSEDHEHGFALKIGSADKEIVGDHHYRISYDYVTPPDRTAVDDLLFYSLLGGSHEAETEEFTFAVRFDKPVPGSSLSHLKAFYGANGDERNRSRQCLTFVSDTLITGVVRNLRPHESVTLSMTLPDGYYTYAEESEDDSSLWWYAAAVSVILIVILLVRESFTRNNYTKVIECWPPKGLSSADIGYIYDTTVDDRDIISLIPYLANKGYLTIDTTSGHPVLTKVKEMPENSPKPEKKFFDALFSDGDVFDTDKPSKKFADCWLSMADSIKVANKNIGNKCSWTILLVFPIGLAILVMLGMMDITNNETLLFCGLGELLLMSYIGGTSLALGEFTLMSRFWRGFIRFTWLIVAVLQYAFFLDFKEYDEIFLTDEATNVLCVIYILLLVCSVFAYRLISMSKKRLESIGQIVGLKEFIEKSEKPLLDSLTKQDERYFYDILPYAVAFNLSEKWAKQFEGIAVRQPEWFTSQDSSLHDLAYWMTINHLYTHSMRHDVRTLQSERFAEQSKSSASSHGVGGFSGGGFGGGGSHSW